MTDSYGLRAKLYELWHEGGWTYRPVANKCLCKQRPLLGNIFLTRTNGLNKKTCSVCGPCDICVTQQQNCLKRCFVCDPCRRVVSRTRLEFSYLKTRVEAGSNTSTVTQRVVVGDEKGSLKSETVKYGREYQGTQTREILCWQGPVAYTKDRPPHLVRECAPQKQDRNCQTSNKYLVMGSRWSSTPRLTDWPSVAMWLWLWLQRGSRIE
jgi:hypothetical protein